MQANTVQLTEEQINEGLRLHRLQVEKISQLSDAFRAGMRYAASIVQTGQCVPEGFVLVPVEPTAEMIDEGWRVKTEFEDSYAGTGLMSIGEEAAKECYRLMVAAAQQKEKGKKSHG